MLNSPKFLGLVILFSLLGTTISFSTAPITLAQSVEEANQGDRQSTANEYLQRGIRHYQADEHAEALLAFQQALQLYREIGDRTAEGATLANLGHLYKSLQQYDQAIEFYQQGYQLLQEQGKLSGAAGALLGIGNTYREQELFEQAAEVYLQALDICRHSTDLYCEATVLRRVGAAYHDLGQYEVAIRTFTQMLSLAQTLESRKHEKEALEHLGWAYRALENPEQAIGYYQQFLALARELEDQAGTDRALGHLAALHQALHQYEEEISFLQQDLALVQAMGDRAREILIFSDIGTAYVALGDYPTAIEYYQQNLTIARELGDRAEEASALNNLGVAYSNLSQYDNAINAQQQNLAIAQELGDRHAEGLALTNLGTIYHQQGRYEQAIALYQSHLSIVQTLGDRAREGAIFRNLGIAYKELDRYQQAINTLQQGLSIAQEVDDEEGIVNAQLNLGTIYRSLGQYFRALELYELALDMAETRQDRALQAKVLGNLGIVHRGLKQYSEAIAFFEQSLELSRQLGNQSDQASTLHSLGILHRRLGDYAKAIGFFGRSLAIHQEIGDRAGKVSNLRNLGLIALGQGHNEQALQFLQESIAIAEEVGDRSGAGYAHAYLGLLYAQQSQLTNAELLTKAEVELRTAIALRQDLIPTELEPVNQLSLLNNWGDEYSTLQLVLAFQNKPLEALEVSEAGRSRALVTQLARQLSPEVAEKISLDPPTLAQMQHIAREQNATLVEYSLMMDGFVFIWVIQPDGTIETRIGHEATLQDSFANIIATLEDLRGDRGHSSVASTQTPFTDEETIQIALKQLHELLIDPISDLMPANETERIIFIPHQALFRVPFAALMDGDNRYLIEKHTILTAPSIQSLSLTRQHRLRIDQTPRNKALVVGNPTLSHALKRMYGWRSLSGATQEAQTISRDLESHQIPVTLLLAEDATESAVLEKLHSARYVHLATHGSLAGRLDQSQTQSTQMQYHHIPGFIALAEDTSEALSQIGSEAGVLTANEMIQHTRKYPLNAELVVLSACQTGQGPVTSDGTYDLSWSILAAGAPSLVVSLWDVSDLATQRLMTEFYQHMLLSGDKAQALRQAILTTMEEFPEVKNWAAFRLIGEAE